MMKYYKDNMESKALVFFAKATALDSNLARSVGNPIQMFETQI